MVEKASTLFISVCVHAMVAASNADIAPTYATKCNAPGADNAKTGNSLATKKTPATTIVAACINADTGVGPSIASGSQICNGNMALLPAAPMKTNTIAHVNAEMPMKDEESAALNSVEPGDVNLSISVLKSSVPE